MANPYPDPELTKVLTRQYKIADITWSDAATDPYGTSLGTVDLMKLLVEIRNISDKLTQFRWLRADIDIEVRLNATPFHIGSVVMSYLPRTVANPDSGTLWTLRMLTMAQKTQNHGVILSASSMNNVSFSIKREAATVLDPIDEDDIYDGCLGALDFSVLNPLILAGDGSVAPVNIAVFASFSNPRPAGLGYFPILGTPVNVRPQSLDVGGEAMSRAAGAITTPEAMKMFAPSLSSGPMDAFTSIIKAVEPAAQFALSLGLSKPANVSTTVPAIIDDFRDLNYGHGVAQTTKMALHPGASLGEPVAGFLSKNSIKQFISKPSLIIVKEFDKTDVVDTSLLKIPVHPSLCAMDDTIITPTPLAYASQSFSWYRGGMKFFFQFISSQFVTARFRITHWPAPTLPTSIEAFAGDAVSMIVDVRGDTPVTFVAPYISPYPYQATRGYLGCREDIDYALLPLNEQNSFITLSLINVLQQPDFAGNAKIYLNVYAGAAEDFIFGGLLDPVVRTPVNSSAPPPPIQVRPQSLEVAFGKPFKAIIESQSAYEAGVVLPEQYSGIEELCMKYSVVDDPAVGITGLVAQYDLRDDSLTAITDPLNFWGTCFRWNRGAVRWKFIFEPTTLAAVRFVSIIRVLNQAGVNTGQVDWQVIMDASLRSVLEVELVWPLNAQVNSYWNSITADNNVNLEPYSYFIGDVNGNPVVPAAAWRSAADDFVFGHQIAMPYLDYTPPAPPVAALARNHLALRKKKLTSVSLTPELDQSLGLPTEVREKLRKYLLLKESSAVGH